MFPGNKLEIIVPREIYRTNCSKSLRYDQAIAAEIIDTPVLSISVFCFFKNFP